MGKAENGEIREVTANIWEDRKHHLWFPLSFTKYTVGNGRLYVNSGFLSSREDECLLYRITDITLYRSLVSPSLICLDIIAFLSAEATLSLAGISFTGFNPSI